MNTISERSLRHRRPFFFPGISSPRLCFFHACVVALLVFPESPKDALPLPQKESELASSELTPAVSRVRALLIEVVTRECCPSHARYGEAEHVC